MPTYDYQCDACGHRFELFQSITARAVRKCPVCGRRKVRRLISGGGGILFKGSGFYATDYRSEAYKQAAKSESPSAGAGDSSDGGDSAKSAASDKGEGAAKTAGKGGESGGKRSSQATQ